MSQLTCSSVLEWDREIQSNTETSRASLAKLGPSSFWVLSSGTEAPKTHRPVSSSSLVTRDCLDSSQSPKDETGPDAEDPPEALRTLADPASHRETILGRGR